MSSAVQWQRHQLSAITAAHPQWLWLVRKRFRVGSGGQFLSNLPRHYWALLASGPTKATVHSGNPATDMCPCGKCQMMLHIVNSCPPWRVSCRDCTQLMTLPLNGWWHTARKCTRQQQQYRHINLTGYSEGLGKKPAVPQNSTGETERRRDTKTERDRRCVPETERKAMQHVGNALPVTTSEDKQQIKFYILDKHQ